MVWKCRGQLGQQECPPPPPPGGAATASYWRNLKSSLTYYVMKSIMEMRELTMSLLVLLHFIHIIIFTRQTSTNQYKILNFERQNKKGEITGRLRRIAYDILVNISWNYFMWWLSISELSPSISLSIISCANIWLKTVAITVFSSLKKMIFSTYTIKISLERKVKSPLVEIELLGLLRRHPQCMQIIWITIAILWDTDSIL